MATNEEQSFEEFWAARDAHAKQVAAKLVEVQDAINAGVDAGLYRDGLTQNLAQTQATAQHLARQLDPSLIPAPSVPLAPINPPPAQA